MAGQLVWPTVQKRPKSWVLSHFAIVSLSQLTTPEGESRYLSAILRLWLEAISQSEQGRFGTVLANLIDPILTIVKGESPCVTLPGK